MPGRKLAQALRDRRLLQEYRGQPEEEAIREYLAARGRLEAAEWAPGGAGGGGQEVASVAEGRRR
jgi:hypothetical protein